MPRAGCPRQIDASQPNECGAQGVPLTPGRSIAVDKDSIPYGTPVWLASSGPAVNLQRLITLGLDHNGTWTIPNLK